ncbi:MAG: LON peptidase substrate-binding domain-containing protein, partial [Nitrospinae bacterium]|nr:LON peptidase substrate-binding domain-containing protein [Nitrospinota bacterium]
MAETGDSETAAVKEEIKAIQDDFTIPDILPLLPVRDIVVFPFMILPLFVGRENSINAVNQALAGDRIMMLAAQK